MKFFIINIINYLLMNGQIILKINVNVDIFISPRKEKEEKNKDRIG